MLTFFHGWRRKMGAAMLVIACLMMEHWLEVMDHIWSKDPAFDGQQLTAAGISTITMTLLSAFLLLSKPRAKPNHSDDTRNKPETFEPR